MEDLDINAVLRSRRHSKQKIYRKFVYWFVKHYFLCDIHPNMQMADTVQIAHNGLGCVINQDAVIGENVIIQHHVTIGLGKGGVPKIFNNVYIGVQRLLVI